MTGPIRGHHDVAVSINYSTVPSRIWRLQAGRSYLSLGLLLGCGLGLGSFLPVASDHDHANEGADNGGAEEDEDDGYADCPDARREEVV